MAVCFVFISSFSKGFV